MPTTGADNPWPEEGRAFVPLTTDRLRLRPFGPDDAPPVQQFLGTEQLAKQTINLPYPFETRDAVDWVQTTIDDLSSGSGYTLAIEQRTDGILMGAAGLQIAPHVPKRAELGYWVAHTFWGKGIAIEAVSQLIEYGRNEAGLNEIWACVFSENVASRRVLEKSGFEVSFTRDEDCPARGGHRSITYYDLV